MYPFSVFGTDFHGNNQNQNFGPVLRIWNYRLAPMGVYEKAEQTYIQMMKVWVT